MLIETVTFGFIYSGLLVGDPANAITFAGAALSPPLLTGETSDRFDDDYQVLDDHGSCRGPHQTAA